MAEIVRDWGTVAGALGTFAGVVVLLIKTQSWAIKFDTHLCYIRKEMAKHESRFDDLGEKLDSTSRKVEVNTVKIEQIQKIQDRGQA